MPRIPGLPRDWLTENHEILDLSICPEGPSGIEAPVEFLPYCPIDPSRQAKVEQWERWAHEVLRYRHGRWMACHGEIPYLDVRKEREKERLLCEHAGPAYFITVWVSVHEAREEQLENHPWQSYAHNGWLPAILYPYQYELLDWIEERANSRGAGANGAVSKSRDMGVTSLLCYAALWRFLFTSPFSAKLISRKEALVDEVGNLDSMMERIATMLFAREGNRSIPDFLLPPGLGPQHRTFMKIVRPDLPNIVNGESTSSRTGRGGRSTWIYLDEAAFIEELGRVLTAVQATTGHVFVFSSESVQTNETFIRFRERLKELEPRAVKELDFYLHPYHGRDWVIQQWDRYLADDNRHGFFNEIARDPYAGFGGWMYDYARENADALMQEPPPVETMHERGKLYLAIDPGQKDDTAIHWIFRDYDTETDIVLHTYEASGLPPEYYAAIICGADPDNHPEFTFSERARDLIEWVNTLPEPRMIFGDPYGASAHLAKDDTFYTRMVKFWRAHNPHRSGEHGRIYGIGINWKPEARQYQSRRNALHMWLRTRLRFDPNDRQSMRTLTALQQSRWEDPDESSRPRMAEQKTARHDEWSHRRTALEFAAVNMDVVPTDPNRQRSRAYTVRETTPTTSMRRRASTVVGMKQPAKR